MRDHRDDWIERLEAENEALRKQNEALRKQNAELADALQGYNSRPFSNTDVILGAALSGGDPIALAQRLDASQKKWEVEQAARSPGQVLKAGYDRLTELRDKERIELRRPKV